MSGYVPEEAFARARELFERITGWLAGPEAAGLEHAALEDRLEEDGQEVQRLLQGHLDLRAACEPRRADVAGGDGIPRTRAGKDHPRPLTPVFGEVTVSRIAYRAPGAPNVHPADAELNLPPGKHSHGLCKLAVTEAACGSFAQASAAVARETGVVLSTRQVQELTVAAAGFGGFYDDEERRPPPCCAPGQLPGMSCDGKGILTLPGSLRPHAARKAARSVPKQDGRLSRGEVRTRKRMAEAGSVFGITPAARTASDVIRPPGSGPAPPGPGVTGKWVTASVADDAAAVVAAVSGEAGRRAPDHDLTWIALADGNLHQIARFQAEAAARGVTVTILCDFIHVAGHLWKAAWSFYPEASPDAGPWVRARAILNGHAIAVAANIRDTTAARAGQLTAGQRKTARATASYLDAKAPYLGYPAALAAGWPISTGLIEGACRHIVKTRWTSPAPDGAPKPPRPSSKSALSAPTATSTPTGPTTSSANANATTPSTNPAIPDATTSPPNSLQIKRTHGPLQPVQSPDVTGEHSHITRTA